MAIRLDSPNPAMEQDAIDELQANNVKQLRSTLNKQAAQILVQVTNTGAYTTTSTSEVKLPGFEKTFTCSGGLIRISFQSSNSMTADQAGWIRIKVDGEEKTISMQQATGVTRFVVPVYIVWIEKMGEGRHTVAITAQVSGGTFIIGSAGGYAYQPLTQLWVEEILL